MDPKKAEVIDRFTQAISLHGLNLVNDTKNAHGYAKGSPLDFLVPSQANIEAANYFNHRLQQVSFNNGSGRIDQSLRLQPSFQERIRKFIATKSDLLFEMKGREELRRGIDYGLDNNHEVLDLYSKVPPLEVFMGIPGHVKRWQLLKVMKEGDIILGEVVSKRPFGIFVKLTALEFSKTRDFTDTNIEALCRTIDLDDRDSHREHKDPADAFLIGDCVRGVITNVCLEEERIAISFKSTKLPEQHQHLHLGLLEDVDRSEERYEYSESRSYAEHLETHVGLNNPRNIATLLDILGVDTNQSCSLLRSFQRIDYPEGEYFDVLRKKQSAKWSMESTAKGVELFKAGDVKTAMKYLEHALQIDGENVEALVARGALSANEGKFSISINDFRQALSINSHHKNANKYLVQTLIEQGIQQEKNGLLTEASHSFKEALDLNPEQATAKERLENVRQLLSIKRQREEKRGHESQDLKSKFSHVRQLIEEEQTRKKKKKKKEKKKRKKQRSEKKKKRRKSLTSSETSDSSSYESESKAESPRKNSEREKDENGKIPEEKTRMPFEGEQSHVLSGTAHHKTNNVKGEDSARLESQASFMNQSYSTSKAIDTETTSQKRPFTRSHSSRSPSTSDETFSRERKRLKVVSKTSARQRKGSRSGNGGRCRSRSSSSSDRRSARRSRRSPDHSRSRKLSRRNTRSRSASIGSRHSRSSSSSNRRSARRSRRSPDHSRSRKLSRRNTRSRSASIGSRHSRSSSSSEYRRSARRSRRSPDHSRSRKLSRRNARSRSASIGSSHSRSSSSSDRRSARRSRRSPDHSRSRKLSRRNAR